MGVVLGLLAILGVSPAEAAFDRAVVARERGISVVVDYTRPRPPGPPSAIFEVVASDVLARSFRGAPLPPERPFESCEDQFDRLSDEESDELTLLLGPLPLAWCFYFATDPQGAFLYEHVLDYLRPVPQDMDGDGFDNFGDPDPYDAAVHPRDSDSDGIPDHLDLSGRRRPRELAELQAEIYNESRVIAFESGGELKVGTLRALRELVTVELSAVFEGAGGHLPELKYVSLSPEIARVEDGDSLWGLYRPQESRVLISDDTQTDERTPYSSGPWALLPEGIPPIAFHILLHELGHVVENHLEASRGTQFLLDGFYSGRWDGPGSPVPPWLAHGLATQEVLEIVHNGTPIEFAFANSKLGRSLQTVSAYAFLSKREDFAESLVAYVFRSMIAKQTTASFLSPLRAFVQSNGSECELGEPACWAFLSPRAIEFFESVLGLGRDLRWLSTERRWSRSH